MSFGDLDEQTMFEDVFTKSQMFCFLHSVASLLEKIKDLIPKSKFPVPERATTERLAGFYKSDKVAKDLRKYAWFRYYDEENLEELNHVLNVDSFDETKLRSSEIVKRQLLDLLYYGWFNYNSVTTQAGLQHLIEKNKNKTSQLKPDLTHYRHDLDPYCIVPDLLSAILLDLNTYFHDSSYSDSFTTGANLLSRYRFLMLKDLEIPDDVPNFSMALIMSFIRSYESTLAQKRDTCSARHIMANELKVKGNEVNKTNKALALSYYSQALVYEPENVILLSNRAAMFQELDDHQSAIKDLKRAIEIVPNFTIGHTRLAYSYLFLGNAFESMKSYANALKSSQGLILPKELENANKFHKDKYVAKVTKQSSAILFSQCAKGFRIAESRARQQGITEETIKEIRRDIEPFLSRYKRQYQRPRNMQESFVLGNDVLFGPGRNATNGNPLDTPENPDRLFRWEELLGEVFNPGGLNGDAPVTAQVNINGLPAGVSFRTTRTTTPGDTNGTRLRRNFMQPSTSGIREVNRNDPDDVEVERATEPTSGVAARPENGANTGTGTGTGAGTLVGAEQPLYRLGDMLLQSVAPVLQRQMGAHGDNESMFITAIQRGNEPPQIYTSSNFGPTNRVNTGVNNESTNDGTGANNGTNNNDNNNGNSNNNNNNNNSNNNNGADNNDDFDEEIEVD